jgi:DUF1365 family protein
MNSCLYECHVMHARFAPRKHRFLYRIFMFAFDLDELPSLHRRLPFFSLERANLFSFRERDFFPTDEPLHHASTFPPADPICNLLGYKPASPASPSTASIPDPLPSKTGNLKSRVIAYLAARGTDLTGGRVVLVTLPRVFGYLFNPVSFYFCYDATGTCVASLAEVTNTFKEMKPYFLGPETRAIPNAQLSALSGQLSASAPVTPKASPITPKPSSTSETSFRLHTPKHFYVSPFSDVDVAFDFTLRTPGERLSIQIDDYVGAERTLTSTLAGPRRALTGARLAWFTVKYPLITLRIIALIHWHAALLWFRKLPWFAKSARASDQRDLYRPHSSLAHNAAAAVPAAKIPVTSEAL